MINNTVADKLTELERKTKILQRQVETEKKVREFKFPFKWRMKLRKSNKKAYSDQVLIMFLNKKGQIEPPKFMPVFDGNMIVWKNKPYEFDPRAVWRVLGMKGQPHLYLIKEIDRRPVKNLYGKMVYGDAAVSNLDIDEVKARGDSTDSDELLIKAALKAQTASAKKAVNVTAMVIIGLIVVGAVIYFMTSG